MPPSDALPAESRPTLSGSESGGFFIFRTADRHAGHPGRWDHPVMWQAALIGGGAGIVTGSISSLVAPWAHWSIEKRRLDLTRKRELVDRWQAGLAASYGLDAPALEQQPWYLELRRYLTVDELYKVEAHYHRMSFVTPEDAPPIAFQVCREAIARLQHEWGLA